MEILFNKYKWCQDGVSSKVTCSYCVGGRPTEGTGTVISWWSRQTFLGIFQTWQETQHIGAWQVVFQRNMPTITANLLLLFFLKGWTRQCYQHPQKEDCNLVGSELASEISLIYLQVFWKTFDHLTLRPFQRDNDKIKKSVVSTQMLTKWLKFASVCDSCCCVLHGSR